MEHWDQFRTAYAVAVHGTVSGAASALGVHRATVVRHVDALEVALGARLFQRHGRGYVPTEEGEDLLRVVRATDEQLGDLAERIRGRSSRVSGELVVTSMAFLAPLLAPALGSLHASHPDLTVRFEASDRLYRLEYGEAHVAVRGGARPTDPDNVVQPLLVLRSALYAHRRYLDRRPETDAYVLDTRAGTGAWLRSAVPEARVVFQTDREHVAFEAIDAGMGIGFSPVALGDRRPDWVQVEPPRPEWDFPLWIVTHVDLHHTTKVRAGIDALKDALA